MACIRVIQSMACVRVVQSMTYVHVVASMTYIHVVASITRGNLSQVVWVKSKLGFLDNYQVSGQSEFFSDFFIFLNLTRPPKVSIRQKSHVM